MKLMRSGSNHEAATTTLDLTLEYLANPRVTQALGVVAEKLLEVAAMVEVPDTIFRRIRSLPDYRNRNVVPFLVMERGKPLLNPMVECLPLQRQLFKGAAATLEPTATLEPYLDEPYTIQLSNKGDGATWGGWSKHNGVYRAERPIVAVRQTTERQMALDAAHELIHLVDILTPPQSNESPVELRATTELKAYTASHAVDICTSVGGTITDPFSARIAAIAWPSDESFEGLDTFRATDDMRTAITDGGLDAIWY